MSGMKDVLAVILGGGRGLRLYPLTKMRAKPAVPIAGKYRLIDIPLSNCINSGITHIHVLTQFNSVSLHRHIAETYSFDAFHTGWVQVLAAEQTPTSEAWYMGTADAVRKQIGQIQSASPSHVVILAGDHLYRMDYKAMVESHIARGADITVGVQPVAVDEADRFGILKCAADDRIEAFVEKPKDPKVQEAMRSIDDPVRPFLGSMGIYVFRTEVLLEILQETTGDDFGSNVIPEAIGKRPVFGYRFEGYWRDIGTIRSFYDTNLELTQPDAPFNFYDAERPIYTHSRFLPGTIATASLLKDALLAEGSQILEATITRSIVGLRSQIGRGTRIQDSILMGADHYPKGKGGPALGIGENCHIEGAILDKNVTVGANVVIKPFPLGTELDAGHYVVQDGIVVIPKGTVLSPGTTIAP